MAVQSAAERLKHLKKVAAKPAEPAAKKAGTREVSIPEALQARVRDLIEIAAVAGELEPQLEQHKKSIGEEFFHIYTQEMWDTKKHPDNFKVVVRRNGMADGSVNFILKFRNDGVKKKFAGDVPENKTLEDMVHDSLISGAVGLSAENARKFFSEEIVIKEDMQFVRPINELLEEPEGSVPRKAVEKLLAYGAARPMPKGHGKPMPTTVTLEAMTDEEEASVYAMKSVVLLKDGVEERIWSYVDNIAQLRQLMLFCGCVRQVSNFEFGISDDASTKSSRMSEAAKKYLAVA